MPKKILSLGGSLVCPSNIDTIFLQDFRDCVLAWLKGDKARQIALIVGGGSLARRYQEAYIRLCKYRTTDKTKDQIGINATYLNAQLVASTFECSNMRVQHFKDYERDKIEEDAQIIVAGGWKPGFSTDRCAVSLAVQLKAKHLVNLSNITKVYTADPKTHPNATPIDTMTREEFQQIVGTEWIPGGNYPFDPIASQVAKEEGLSVAIANGKDLANLIKILNNKPFEGTTIRG